MPRLTVLVFLLLTPSTALRAQPEPVEYLALKKGNVWEYAVVNEVDGERQAPTALRFIIFDRQPGPGAFTDYLVSVDVYDGDEALRRTLCRFRTNGNKPFLIATNRIDRGDCAYQSPILAADVEQETRTTRVMISESEYDTPFVGIYQTFWSNQSGESGYIANHYAPGLSLYRYENRRTPSALDPSSGRTSWVGELVYAQIDGLTYGTSRLADTPNLFGPAN